MMMPAHLVKCLQDHPGTAAWMRPCDWREVAEYLLQKSKADEEVIEALRQIIAEKAE